MDLTRRHFLRGCGTLGAVTVFCRSSQAEGDAQNNEVRRFNLSVSVDALNADPGLLDIVRDAGVTDLWLACFFNGNWYHSTDELHEWKRRIEEKGMALHNITIPLGHPSFSETPPDYMPDVSLTQWKRGVRPDGTMHYGVSLHPPATEENVAALQKIKTTDPKIVFVDDDFRLAPSPHDIGGCFCETCKRAFLDKHGYSGGQWDELLDAVGKRDLKPVLRAWVDDICDKLTGSFKAQQAALAPEAQLGIMVMFLGSEKAGIRLTNYTGMPFRVGELMFNDASFTPVKGKTDELFSALFHRRFTPPGLAYSETTAWPPDSLSAANMTAKLAVSTIADVRNTMFMSGNTPFPTSHWETLAPAMRKQAAIHRELAGHRPQGPFKHFWGEASRWVGDANPYSLFLATGVPFEICSEPVADGWTFLSDADARALPKGTGTTFLCRPAIGASSGRVRTVPESLDALFAFKHELMPHFKGIPIVEEDIPAVCAWYPSARRVFIWNLSEEKRYLTIRQGMERHTVTIGPLDAELVSIA